MNETRDLIGNFQEVLILIFPSHRFRKKRTAWIDSQKEGPRR